MSASDIRKHLSWAMFVFGVSAALLNVTIIVRILKVGLKKIHRVKVYFGSLAIADLIFSFGIIGHWLLTRNYIKLTTIDEINIAMYWWRSTQGLSFVSNVLHVIVITIDRFIATKYPILHRIRFGQSNGVIVIITIWALSILATSTQFWLPLAVIDWIVNIGILIGSILCTVTYITIAHILYAGKTTLGKLSIKSKVNHTKSLNTTRLGASITVAFILCNLPFCIASFIQGENWNPVVSMVMYTSLSVNCVINPIAYNILDFVNKDKTLRNRVGKPKYNIFVLRERFNLVEKHGERN